MPENKASKLFLISSVVLGLLAAVVSFAYLNQATSSDRGPKYRIIVAKHDLRENSTLDPTRDFDEMEVPVRMTALITRGIKPEDAASYKNQRVNRRILAGTPIMLADMVVAADLEIKGDSRALSIPVKGAQALSGLLIPGDHVKLLVTTPTIRPRRSATEPAMPAQFETTQVLPEALKVLAVGSRLARTRLQISVQDQYESSSSGESDAQKTITLEVTEAQATAILSQTGAGQLPVTLLLCPPTPK
jgi:Flp pilus assembly protein CpaB